MVKNNLKDILKIKIIGVGGAGGNMINRIWESRIRGIDLIAINTDVQDLLKIKARKKIKIGKDETKGFGTGMDPTIGEIAASKDIVKIKEAIKDSDFLVLVGGLGGGTGSGALPVISELAKEMKILTVGIFTFPFEFEGPVRMEIAQESFNKIKDFIDAYITIENDMIFKIIDKDVSLEEAFLKVDEILKKLIEGISYLIINPGLVNVDFADIRLVLKDAGQLFIGIGEGEGEEKVKSAIQNALNSPILNTNFFNAKRVLFNIIGGPDLTIKEVKEIADKIKDQVDKVNSKIIFGATVSEKMKNKLRLILMASNFSNQPAIEIDSDFEREIFDVPAFLRKNKNQNEK